MDVISSSVRPRMWLVALVAFALVALLAVVAPAIAALQKRGPHSSANVPGDVGEGSAFRAMESRAAKGDVKPSEPKQGDKWVVVLEDDALAAVRGAHKRSSQAVRVAAIRRQDAAIARAKGPVKALIERLEPGKAHEYGDLTWALAGFVVEMDERTAEQVRKHPSVKRVEREILTPTDIFATVPAAGGQHLADSHSGDGSGSTIAILDTGVDYTHPDLGGGFGPGYKVKGGYDFYSADADPMDLYGHGTNVAGVAAADGLLKGMAPKAEILAYRVGSYHISSTAVLQAINDALDPDHDPATDDAADVISLSSGTSYLSFADAAANAFKAGVVTVVSMGNSGEAFWTLQCSDSDVIGVAADTRPDSNYLIMNFSSRGPTPTFRVKPDVAAPSLVTSTKMGGGYAGGIFGTSFASPHVSGMVAALRSSHPEWDAETLRAATIEGSKPNRGYHVAEQGAGSIDAVSSSELRGVMVPPTLSFGWADPSVPVWETSREVSLRNVCGEPKTFALRVDADAPAGITYSLDATSVALGAGEAATVTVTVRADTAVAPDCPHATRAYDGRVVAEADGHDAVVPFLFGFQRELVPSALRVLGPTKVLPNTTGYFNAVWRGSVGVPCTITYSVDSVDVYSYTGLLPKAPTNLFALNRTLTEGMHSVQVRMSNAFGATQSDVLAVNVAAGQPKETPAAPTITVPSSSVLANVTFSIYGSDPNGLPMTYEVDWGEGSTTTHTALAYAATTAMHTWGAYGPKQVRARAIDASGSASPWSDPLSVTVHAMPQTPATPTGPTVVSPGSAVQYAVSTAHADGGDVTYEWDWGDGTFTTEGPALAGTPFAVSKQWDRAGVYKVKVRALDGASRYREGSPDFYPNWSQPLEVIVLGADRPQPPALTVPQGIQRTWTFQTVTVAPSLADSRPVGFQLDWGDRAVFSSDPAGLWAPKEWTHAYNSGSVHVKTLRARSIDANGETSEWTTSSITVNTPPNKPVPTVYSTAVAGENSTPFYVTVSDADVDYQTVRFDWGDGTSTDVGGIRSGRNAIAPHAFTTTGTVVVGVRSFDGMDWSEECTVPITVIAKPRWLDLPAGLIYADATVPYTPSLRAEDMDGGILTYEINWGDGTSETTEAPTGERAPLSHSYASSYWGSTLILVVRVHDTMGWYGEPYWGVSWQLNVGPAPHAPALTAPTVTSPGTEADFTALASAPWYSPTFDYTFEWGDGTETTATGPWGVPAGANKSWTAEGLYSVRARAKNQYGSSPWSESRTVVVAAPPAAPHAPQGPGTVDLNDPATYSVQVPVVMTGTVDVSIDWGDGTTTTLEDLVPGSSADVTHSWAEVGLHSVTARAVDVFGRSSATSGAMSVNVIDTVSPTPPLAVAAMDVPGDQGRAIDVAWSAASDNVGVAGYRVYRGMAPGVYDRTLDVTATNLRDTVDVTPGAAYFYAVKAFDAAGNESVLSPEAFVVATDDLAPAAPIGVHTTSSSYAATVWWTANTEPDLVGYRIYRAPAASGPYTLQFPAGPTTTGAQDPSVVPDTAYYYVVTALDSSGNESAQSIPALGGADVSAPSKPQNVTAAGSGPSTIDLAWTASTDGVGVVSYRIERATSSKGPWTQVGTSATNAFTASGLSANTTYYFRVRAVDFGGNTSAYSQSASARTLVAPPDTTKPTAPTNLTATAAGSNQINLAWAASTDNVGVSQYRIERSADGVSFTQIGTSTSTSYSATGLTASTHYYFRVRAADAAGNVSDYSAVADAITAQAPPGPVRLEETNAAVTYTGSWANVSNASYSGGTMKTSAATGNSATLTFTGSSVTWIGAKAASYGQARVYIDGVLMTTVDCYARNAAYRTSLFTAGVLPGQHTIRIEVAGTKATKSSGYAVPVDAFDVTP